MNIEQNIEQNPRARMLNKFYARVREHMVEHQSNSSVRFQAVPRDQVRNNIDLSKVSEDKLFGNITKEEFSHIIAAYDRQQQDASAKNRNKPVECDKVIGKNYNKLLNSKPGFHNMDSTAYLVNDLRIKDLQRSSFLGGNMIYCAKREEDISSLLKDQQSMRLCRMKEQVLKKLDDRETSEAEIIINEMSNIDDQDTDFLIARGSYRSAIGQKESAIDDFRKALQARPDDLQFKAYLSEALQSLSVKLYQQREYSKALSVCREAIEYDPDNSAAQLHLNMCSTKVQANIPFARKPPQARR